MVGNIVLTIIIIISIYNYVKVCRKNSQKKLIKAEKRSIATVLFTTVVILLWRLF